LSVSHPLADDGPYRNSGDASGTRRHSGPASGSDGSTARTGSQSKILEEIVVAPAHLGLESRVEFRRIASRLIDRISAGTGRLVIDCERMKSIDSAGLNSLIILQRRAAKGRIQVVLRALDKEILALLVLTKLDDLFEISLTH